MSLFRSVTSCGVSIKRFISDPCRSAVFGAPRIPSASFFGAMRQFVQLLLCCYENGVAWRSGDDLEELLGERCERGGVGVCDHRASH